MVVARAPAAQRVRAGPVAQRAHRRLGGDGAERLDDLGDGRPGQAEVAVAPVALDGEEARVDEASEMLAGRRPSDAGLAGQDAGGQRAAVHEREQDARPGRLGEDTCRGGDVEVALHRHTR